MVPPRKRQEETNGVQIEIEKRKEEKKKIKKLKARTQERKKARAQTSHIGNTQTCRLASSAGEV